MAKRKTIKKKSKNNLHNFLQKGQVARLLLVLAIVVLVAVVISYLVMKMAERPQAPSGTEVPEIPMPVYEQTLGDARFLFMSAIDMGNVLKVSDSKNKTSYSWRQDQDVVTTERFIKVTIGAQNKGKLNILDRSWDIGNIVDSEGRNFVPMDLNKIQSWLPEDNYCGELLKPEFEPIPCTKIYEVSKISTGLKIRVLSGKNNQPTDFSPKNRDEALIDLIVK
jgi:hypothetical protein